MGVPVQMTQHTLTALKGWLPGNFGSLDFTAKLAAAVTIDPVYAGRCMHLNASGALETGVPDGTGENKIHMPLFVFQTSSDPDVSNPGGITGSTNDAPGGWASVSSRGAIACLVALGGYELETTEFDSTLTYEPGHALKAVNANTNATTGGRLTLGIPHTDPIVGIVSRGKAENTNRVKALSFWPYVLPVG